MIPGTNETKAMGHWLGCAIFCLFCCGVPALVFAAPQPRARAAKTSKWAAMLARADQLDKAKSKADKRKAADLMLKAYALAPRKRRSLIAAARACLIRAMLTKKGRDIVAWGRRGVKYAKQLMARWPNRAEGYFWASVNYGQYARGGGILVAITKGLAGKIEKMAIKSFRRDSSLYEGAAQRVLGRYYYRLPWPMRNLKKSALYLEHALKRFPKHTGNQFYLAETLWARGKKARALQLYRRCAKARSLKSSHANTGIRCYKWLRKHKK